MKRIVKVPLDKRELDIIQYALAITLATLTPNELASTATEVNTLFGKLLQIQYSAGWKQPLLIGQEKKEGQRSEITYRT